MMLQALLHGRRRPVRFIAVGIWNTGFGYGVFYLLDTLLTPLFDKRYMAYMTALVLAQVLGTVNAYLFHRRYTFGSNVRGLAMGKEFIRFTLTYAVSFGVNLVLLPVLVEVAHIAPKISGLLLVVVTTFVSYFGHSRFSFRS